MFTHEIIATIDLPQGSITFLEKDSFNRLVIGTDNELKAYDGKESITIWNCDPDERIQAFQKTSNRNKSLVVTDKNIYALFGTRRSTDSVQHLTPVKNLISYFFLEDEMLYQDDLGIHLLNLNSLKKIKLPELADRILTFHYYDNDIYLFGNKIYRWRKNDSDYQEISIQLPPGINTFVTGKNMVYIISETNQLWQWDLSDKEPTYLDRISNFSPVSVAKMHDDQLYIGTQRDGMHIHQGGTKQRVLRKGEGLCENKIIDLYIQDANHFWTTDGRRICLTSNRYPVLADEKTGLKDPAIKAIARWDEDIWFGTSDGLFRLKNGALEAFRATSGFLDIGVNALHVLKSNLAWIGTNGSGVVQMNSIEDFKYFSELDFPARTISCIDSDVDGNIFFGTKDEGLWQANMDTSGSWRFERIFSNSIESIIDLLVLDNGDLIIASPGHIFYFEAGRGQLKKLLDHENEAVLDIDLWNGWVYATTGDAVIRVPLQQLGEQKEIFQADQLGLPSVVAVTAISNIIYVSGANKTIALPSNYFDNPSSIEQFTTYDFGMTKNTLNLADNELVAGSDRGIMAVEEDQSAKLKGRMVWDEILVNDVELGLLDMNSFGHTKNRWRFNYSSIHPEVVGPLDYHWSLDGESSNATGMTDQRSVYFPMLPPDNYQFSIKGIGPGIETNTLQFNFHIEPPLQSKNWFKWAVLAAGLLLIGMAVYVATKLSSKRLQKRLAHLEWENEKLEWQQKALQLQMNPHFIFNALNSIQGYIGKDDAQARYYTAKLGKLMRQTLSHARSTWISLSDEMDYLKNYLDLQKLNYPFTYSIDKGSIDENVTIPSMIIQPMVENAVQHGIAKLNNETGKIKISFEYQGRKIKCSVQDNGPGIGKDSDASKHLGVSTKIINERMKIFQKEGLKVDPVQLVHTNPDTDFTTQVSIGLPYKEQLDYE